MAPEDEDDDDEDEFIPFCKPFRIIELVTVTACWVALIAIHFPEHDIKHGQLAYETILYIFAAYYTLLVVGAIDVCCQMLRNPISNTPMIIFCSLFSFASFVTSVLLFAHCSETEETANTFQSLVIINILASLSMFLAVLYMLDTVFIIRCSSRHPIV